MRRSSHHELVPTPAEEIIEPPMVHIELERSVSASTIQLSKINQAISRSRTNHERRSQSRLSYHKQLEKEMQRALNRRDRDDSDIEDSDGEDQTELTSLSKSPSRADVTLTRQKSILSKNYDTLVEGLPDELLVRIWSYLDPISIGRVAQVCRRFRDISYDVPMWRDCALPWLESQSDQYQTDSQKYSYSYFVRQFVSYRKGEKRLELERRREAMLIRDQKMRDRASHIMKITSYGRLWEWVCAICLVLFTILLVLRLDGKISSPWVAVFAPLLFALAQLLLAPSLYDSFRSIYNYNFDKELEPDEDHNRVCGPIFFYLAFPAPFQTDPTTSRCFIYPSIILFITWVTLLVIRLDRPDLPLPWWGVFVPLFALLLLWINIPLWVGSGNFIQDQKRLDRLLCSMIISTVLAFVILLVLKLENYIESSWYVVMSPLWLCKGLILVIPMILCLITLSIFLCDCGEVFWLRHTRWALHWRPLCMTCAGLYFLLVAPLIVFQVLVAQTLEGVAHSWAVVFVPLFVVEGFGVCGCCIVNCAFLCSE